MRLSAGTGRRRLIAPLALVLSVNGARAAAQGSPIDRQLEGSRLLPIPLAALEHEGVRGESEALWEALQEYAKRSASDDTGSLERFLERHRDSRWAPAVWVNLGVIYRRTGYPSRAIEALATAWRLSKNARGVGVAAIADQAAIEQAELLAGFGRAQELRALLGDLRERRLRGSVRQRVVSITRALDVMDASPQTSFICGPLSLLRILSLGRPGQWQRDVIFDAKSRREGVALTELNALARKIELPMRMAFRPPGESEVPTPSVMNLKVRHFVALEKRLGGCYVAYDPSFNQQKCVSLRAVNLESSGYFLIPDGPLPAGWHAVDEMEGWTVWGR